MPPETSNARQFLRLPGGVIDVAAAPPILDKKIRRRAHVERCHEIIVMAAERRDNLLAAHQGQIISLSDIVERIEFHHQVVHAIHRRLDQGNAVVARIDMQETGVDRGARVVADAEAKQVTVERKGRGHVLHQRCVLEGP